MGKSDKSTYPKQIPGYSEDSDRLNSVDFIKGFGIISFILWHCYDYFFDTTILRPPLGRFILYTTGIFIFMSGFIVGYHYYQKYLNIEKDDRYKINNRLYIRAMKLIFYVFIANLASNVLAKNSISILSIKESIFSIISLLYIDRWDIPFQVLVVISLGLAISPSILRFITYNNKLALKIIITLISILCLFDILNAGKTPYLWRYLPLAIIGIIIGQHFKDNHFRMTLQKYKYMYFTCFILLCLGASLHYRWYKYILFETGPYLILTISVFLSINEISIKIFLVNFKLLNRISNVMVLMGQYSLLIYFTQIIFILFVSKLTDGKRFGQSTDIIFISMIVLIIAIFVAYTTSQIRKYYYVNKIYKLIFM